MSHCATCNCRDDEKPAQPARNPLVGLWTKRNTPSFPMPLSRRVARGGINKGMKWEN